MMVKTTASDGVDGSRSRGWFRTWGLIGMSAAAAALFAPQASALSLSRGQQTLDVSYQECLRRAHAAFVGEGFDAQPSQGASFVGGFRGPSGGYITCNPLTDARMIVNVFVASEGTSDPNVPGAIRVRLQQRMESAAASPPAVPPPQQTGVTGRWAWQAGCSEGAYGNRLTIGPVAADGSFTGRFEDEGTLTGRVQGNRIEFTRTGQWAGRTQQQRWTAVLTPAGMEQGTIERPSEMLGNCPFTARMEGAAISPPAPPPPQQAGLAGRWSWQAGCAEGAYGNRLTINPVGADGSFTGKFDDEGTLAGRVQGDRIDFIRTGQWAGRVQQQRWTAVLTPAGMEQGTIERPTEMLGNCPFTARRGG